MGSPVSAVIYLYMESFEEQAITTSSHEPRIWKRYVDDTFTILDRENVDDFLQHLNNQQPSIRFTMETEKDNKLAFLDTAVLREPDGRLTTSVYRKPTHTDEHLAYDWSSSKTQYGVVYRILYECSKVYIGETEDLCKTELRSTIETSNSPVPRPPPFQSIPTTPNTSHSETK